MPSFAEIKAAAEARRELRWKKEKAARAEEAAGRALTETIAKRKKVSPEQLTFSNIACHKAPADMHRVFVKRFNKYGNPCIFCGGWEEDVF